MTIQNFAYMINGRLTSVDHMLAARVQGQCGERGGGRDRGRARLTKRMTATQLRLLRILGLEHVPDGVEQLQVRLVPVRLDGGDEGPGHSARRLGRDGGVRAGLVVLAAAPQDDVGGAGLGPDSLLVGLVATYGALGEAHEGARNPAHVTPRVRHDSGEQPLAGLLGEVGLLQHALG